MAVKLLDFWATWCGPCKMMAPVIKEIETELGDKVEVVEIDVDKEQALASKYGVMSIPTYVIEKDGKEVGRKVGVTAKAELIKLIQS
jgi:thioredoxin 1